MVEQGGRARRKARAVVVRTVLVIALIGAALWWSAATAGAKILPLTSITVSPAEPALGHSFGVVVRFGNGFDLGNYAWENARQ